MEKKRLPSWKALFEHYESIRNARIIDWMIKDANRSKRMTVEAAGITLDFSKNRLNDQTLKLFSSLVKEANIAKIRDAMFLGEKVNITEDRPALHVALRATRETTYSGAEVAHAVSLEKEKMRIFTKRVHDGTWKGHKGDRILDIVNIGIGGSDLGPKMVCHALKERSLSKVRIHFISNVDGTQIIRVLKDLNPATTLGIIASKTFATQETVTNSRTLRSWLLAGGCPEKELPRHLVGISANIEEVIRFGIPEKNIFNVWNWVGGRYSLWSAVGLSIMLQIGSDGFDELLSGAYAMDQHFIEAPFESNLPMIMGIIGIWYRDFFDAQSLLICPYSEALYYLPEYLQQLEMESNGKSMRFDGNPVTESTAAVIWGKTGTDGQHSFFQMLHQGTSLVPIDFIVPLRPGHNLIEHHIKLLANCFAQSEALMLGRSLDEAKRIVDPKRKELAYALVLPGNRPSNTLVIEELTPRALGALIALYEHKVLVQASIWGINPFDQYGVELGKILGKTIELDLYGQSENEHDESTRSLISSARSALQL